MNMSKEEYHKRVNKMYSELRTDRVDADREEVIRCQRLYLAEDRYIPSCEREIERLNNIINELKEWFKGYHKSYASCKWYEEDYIEFIEHLENELKGVDKE